MRKSGIKNIPLAVSDLEILRAFNFANGENLNIFQNKFL